MQEAGLGLVRWYIIIPYILYDRLYYGYILCIHMICITYCVCYMLYIICMCNIVCECKCTCIFGLYTYTLTEVNLQDALCYFCSAHST